MDDPFDEQRLRRALRLDADERPPRLDVAAVRAAAAGAEAGPRPELVAAAVLFAGLALLGAWRVVEIARLAAASALAASDPLEAAVALTLVPAATILGQLARPDSVLALVAVLVVALTLDFVERRGGRVAVS